MDEIVEKINVEKLIYEVRGRQVMLDSDLAKLYGVETKRINEAVTRNKEKFPERFSWKLTKEESELFLVAICDQKIETRGGRYKSPRVFTEQGVAMLSTILKTKIATEISIQIMDAFVAMRKYIGTNLLEQKYINNQVMKNTEDIRLLQESFSKFEEKRKVNEIYFNGQIFDSYSKIVDIFKSANNELIIIDSYADKIVLDMIKDLNIQVSLLVKPNANLKELEIKKYKKQYNNLTLIYDNSFHDRYFIIDKKIIYHCGSSINHAGKKTFSINQLEDEIIKELLIEKVLLKMSNNVLK